MHIEYHPILVHFPIALSVIATLLDVGRWVFDRDRLLRSDFWGGTTPLLLAALLGAFGAIATGLNAEPSGPSEAVHELVEAHETLAFVATGLLAVLSFWRVGLRGAFPKRGGFLYLALSLTLAVVLGYGSYFGGQMVFTHGVGVDAVN
jgi:uncharacterized membrane protein